MGRAAALMMASVFLSRILGYARDAVIAYQHGATPETDAYFAAFTIPDFLNYLLAGGALSITFIPIFFRYIAEGKEEEGCRSFSAIATIMGIAMLFFVILGEFLAERLIPVIAPGFPPDQIAIAAKLTRIVLPAQLFFYLGGLLMAVQYARNRFFLPATAPLIYNAGIIAGGLALGRSHGMAGFAWGVLLGSFAGNFAVQAYGAHRAGLKFFPRIDLADPGLREFVRLSIPIMLGFSLVVVDEWMTRIFGSFLLAGAITWLNNARRLMQVPIGVFGQASGVASYPFLSALAARGEKDAMWDTLSATLRWVFFVSCLAAAVVGVLSREVVLAVFKRGAFTIDDTLKTASALSAFSIGIPLWCAQTIVSRGFFALKDTWTPTLVGTGAWLASLPAYYLLTQKMGVFGLALASSIGIFLHATALYGILMGRTVGRKGIRELAEYGKMAFAGAVAAMAGWYWLGVSGRWVSWETFGGAVIRFAAGGAAMAAVYYLCALLLRSRTARAIKRRRDVFHPPSVPGAVAPPEPPAPGDRDV
ncbi:MAG: murein biosynthesis integral membrane protein MurJ [Deltaproteobacteria bacterium]|nr:murein biosynthesis integral membrane protein MurJ [Deltaproteobacteria bacterium]